MQFQGKNYSLADRAAFQRHCSRKDALIATQLSGRFVLHHRDCSYMQRALSENNADLIYWPKYGLFKQDLPAFQGAAKVAGMEITFSCYSRDCKRGLKAILG